MISIISNALCLFVPCSCTGSWNVCHDGPTISPCAYPTTDRNINRLCKLNIQDMARCMVYTRNDILLLFFFLFFSAFFLDVLVSRWSDISEQYGRVTGTSYLGRHNRILGNVEHHSLERNKEEHSLLNK